MKIVVGFFALILLASGVQALACSANLECGVGCVAIAPPGGSASCYTDDGTATCVSYDENNFVLSDETVSCPTGGGSGGSGGTGGGGGPQYCSIYWWLCDPWAY